MSDDHDDCQPDVDPVIVQREHMRRISENELIALLVLLTSRRRKPSALRERLFLRRRTILVVSATGPRRRGGLGGGVSNRLDGLLIERSTDGLSGRTTRAVDEGAGVAVVLVTMARLSEESKCRIACDVG
ncbi:uncharacterized protein PHALS_04207 [Plasmopara halstedii]|uniref:Uncharacterized protein n=1 Tax=Plasmopara halstedii TaxID=4781 RepID=A0A0P1A9D2_PLAHL|nr:uncharacterized protein PHALS_04207 [Plasmopara halstedii]CEG36958.1 hypothetical protein PHALS_04207 [Plasmopara halstedii]|eukprot:XP_024573327.1 hypothetical protein PHALS_04207 [Plasmopara halstedii]